MTVSKELEAEIRRLHHAEHWVVGTIARQFSIHSEVVRRVLVIEARKTKPGRQSIIVEFTPFIEETLRHFPTLKATVIFDMVSARGFTGLIRTVRLHVSRMRPQRRREAFLRTTPLIGEQSQIDWAFVGNVDIDCTKRAMWMFVIALSWSRE